MVPSFETVPDSWQAPLGPYVQAPAEFGGRWYAVSPFNREPWLNDTTVVPVNPVTLPDGFRDIFGPRPQLSTFTAMPNPIQAWQVAKTKWEQELDLFVAPGWPEWATETQIDNVEALASNWNMGVPMPYENRKGDRVRFVSGPLPFDVDAQDLLEEAHFIIAKFQIKLIQAGLEDEIWERHPFVPPYLFGDEEEED